jgi:hypothetical protein
VTGGGIEFGRDNGALASWRGSSTGLHSAFSPRR